MERRALRETMRVLISPQYRQRPLDGYGQAAPLRFPLSVTLHRSGDEYLQFSQFSLQLPKEWDAIRSNEILEQREPNTFKISAVGPVSYFGFQAGTSTGRTPRMLRWAVTLSETLPNPIVAPSRTPSG